MSDLLAQPSVPVGSTETDSTSSFKLLGLQQPEPAAPATRVESPQIDSVQPVVCVVEDAPDTAPAAAPKKAAAKSPKKRARSVSLEPAAASHDVQSPTEKKSKLDEPSLPEEKHPPLVSKPQTPREITRRALAQYLQRAAHAVQLNVDPSSVELLEEELSNFLRILIQRARQTALTQIYYDNSPELTQAITARQPSPLIQGFGSVSLRKMNITAIADEYAEERTELEAAKKILDFGESPLQPPPQFNRFVVLARKRIQYFKLKAQASDSAAATAAAMKPSPLEMAEYHKYDHDPAFKKYITHAKLYKKYQSLDEVREKLAAIPPQRFTTSFTIILNDLICMVTSPGFQWKRPLARFLLSLTTCNNRPAQAAAYLENQLKTKQENKDKLKRDETAMVYYNILDACYNKR